MRLSSRRLGRLQAALEANDPNLLEGSNYEWECQHCGFRSLCEKSNQRGPNLFTFMEAET